MEKTFKRLLSLAIALVMILGMIPVTQIEAKAETTTEQTQPETTTQPDAKDQSAELLNETQQPAYTFTGVLDADATGKIEAVCPHCSQAAGKEVKVTWEPITNKAYPIIYKSHEHFYVPQNKNDAGEIQGVSHNKANAISGSNGDDKVYKADGTTQIKDSFIFLYLFINGKVCLHLNGSKLSTATCAWLGDASTELNVMGDGTWEGRYAGTATQPYRATTIHNHSAGKINIYSGTITTSSDRAGHAVISAAISKSAKINIHENVTVDGDVMVRSGTVTLNGGTINGRVMLKPISAGVANFVMNSGAVKGGLEDFHETKLGIDDRGGAIHSMGGAVTINGGTVYGLGTEDAPHTANGGAIFVGAYKYESTKIAGDLTMSGGTVIGGVVRGANGGAIAIQGDTTNKIYPEPAITGGTIKDGKAIPVVTYTEATETTAASTKATGGLGGNIYLNAAPTSIGSSSTTTNVTVTGGEAYNGGNVYNTGSKALSIGKNAVISYGKAKTYSDDQEHTVTSALGGNVYSSYSTTCRGEVAYGEAVSHGGNLYIGSASATFAGANVHHGTSGGYGGNVYSAWKMSADKDTTIADGTAARGGNIYFADSVAHTAEYNNGEENRDLFNISGVVTRGTATTGGGGNIYSASKNMNLRILAGSVTDGKCIGTDDDTARGGNIWFNATDCNATLYIGNDSGDQAVVSGGEAIHGGNVYAKNIELKATGTVSGGKATANGANLYVAASGGLCNVYGLVDAGLPDDEACCEHGGAVYNVAGGEVHIYGTVQNGRARYGGNIRNSGTVYIESTGMVKGGKSIEYGGNVYSSTTMYIYGTVQDGKASTFGGNLAIAGGYLTTIDGGKILNGEAATYGGNINSNNGGLLIKGDALIENGVAKNGAGGNIKIFGGTTTNSKVGLQIESGTIIGGKAEAGQGGNIYVYNTGDNLGKLTITGGTVKGGTAGQGGNIYLDKQIKATITNATITEGTATLTQTNYKAGYTGGGNIYVGNSSELTITDTEISKGYAASSGGNIMVQASAVLTLNDKVVVTDGSAAGTISPSGGGNIQTSAGTVNINVGAVVSGGTTEGVGTNLGAIYGGVLNVNGGTVGSEAEKDNVTVRLFSSGDNGASVANVKDGSVYGIPSLSETLADINIYHGKFSVDPSAFIAEDAVNGTKAALQTDGMYGVHVPGEGTANPAPSCSAAGQTDWTCNYTYTVGETTYDCAGYSVAEGQLEHDWADATCTAPKTCKTCGETEGEANGHDWADATCTAAKTCKTCGETEGEANGHDWADATCTAPKTCKTCGETEGEAKGHAWNDATCTAPKTCGTCGATEGEAAGHKLTLIPEVPAQVNKPGAEAYYQCDVCAKKFSDAEGKTEIEAPKEIPALPEVTDDAKVGDTAYATLAEAVAAANANGGQVDLQKDVEVSVLVELATNVVLNLNGHKLTVKENGSVTAIYNDSAVIDTSKGREGRLVVEEGGKLYLPKENRQLPVDMGNGLMFVNVAVNHGKGSINGYQTWIDGMDKELAEALKTTGASKLGLKFQVVLTWGSNELTYTFGDDTVGEYAKNWKTYAMYLKVSGAEGLNLQYKFQIAYTGISTAKVAIDTANEIAH